jgi:hypothetical protein
MVLNRYNFIYKLNNIKALIMKGKILLAFILLFMGGVTYGVEERENHFSVNIRFHRLKFHINEPVVLKMSVKNVSDKNADINIYEKENRREPGYSTFQPVVIDMMGREAEIIVKYRLENRGRDEVLKKLKMRKLTLAPHEELSRTINLRSIYRLEPDRKYRVKGYFFPDFAGQKEPSMSNEISFMVTGEKKVPDRYKPEEIAHHVSPGEIVSLSLAAERERNWKRMFKYYRIEKYISSYPEYVRVYNLADRAGKMRIANEFMAFLSRERSDYILDFNVVRGEIEESGKIAHVNVRVKRFAPRKPDRYLYRYTLERYKNILLIVILESTVIKEVIR